MNRRSFLAAGGGVLALAATPGLACEAGHVPYRRAAYEEALASGRGLLLDFFAPW